MKHGLRSTLLKTLFAALASTPYAHAQSVHHVPADFTTIQQAINAAVNGDTVLVSPGTYLERISLGSKLISVRSTDGPEVTIIDATFLGTVVTIASGATRDTIVEGFTLTRGNGGSDAGGVRISSASPIIRNNIITDNRGGGSGNGIASQFSSALIVGNRITNNRNSGNSSGGGGGGGIYVGGNPCPSNPPPTCGTEIRNNVIEGNTASFFTSGGGIDIFAGGPVKVIANVIRDNATRVDGGGIALANSADARIENNLIVGNRLTLPDSRGGGVAWGTPSGTRGPFLINNTIVDNIATHGSGVHADGFDVAARVINNLIIASPGATGLECGDFNDPFPPIVSNNNVIASGAAPYAGLCANAGGTSGNLSVPPTFFASGDYRLAPGSAGIDAGSNTFATETTDLLGAPRIVDGDGSNGAQVDIGAHEVGDTIFVDGFEL